MKPMLIAATLLALSPFPALAGGSDTATLRTPAPAGLECLFVTDRCAVVELKRNW